MKDLFFIALIIAILTGGIYFVYRSLTGDIPDYMEARQIPKYTDATLWEIEDTSGYPESSPYAEITFKTTEQPEKVVAFYKQKLTYADWKVIKIEKIHNDLDYETGEYTASFKKGNINLRLNSQYFNPANQEQNWNYNIIINRDKSKKVI